MNIGLYSSTDSTILCVYFGALHWCFGESGCLGDSSRRPKGFLDDWQRHPFNLLLGVVFITQECPE